MKRSEKNKQRPSNMARLEWGQNWAKSAETRQKRIERIYLQTYDEVISNGVKTLIYILPFAYAESRAMSPRTSGASYVVGLSEVIFGSSFLVFAAYNRYKNSSDRTLSIGRWELQKILSAMISTASGIMILSDPKQTNAISLIGGLAMAYNLNYSFMLSFRTFYTPWITRVTEEILGRRASDELANEEDDASAPHIALISIIIKITADANAGLSLAFISNKCDSTFTALIGEAGYAFFQSSNIIYSWSNGYEVPPFHDVSCFLSVAASVCMIMGENNCQGTVRENLPNASWLITSGLFLKGLSTSVLLYSRLILPVEPQESYMELKTIRSYKVSDLFRQIMPLLMLIYAEYGLIPRHHFLQKVLPVATIALNSCLVLRDFRDDFYSYGHNLHYWKFRVGLLVGSFVSFGLFISLIVKEVSSDDSHDVGVTSAAYSILMLEIFGANMLNLGNLINFTRHDVGVVKYLSARGSSAINGYVDVKNTAVEGFTNIRRFATGYFTGVVGKLKACFFSRPRNKEEDSRANASLGMTTNRTEKFAERDHSIGIQQFSVNQPEQNTITYI